MKYFRASLKLQNWRQKRAAPSSLVLIAQFHAKYDCVNNNVKMCK